MEEIIKIRMHHLLCIPRFYRGGYNRKFAENMKKIVNEIRKNPNKKIKIIVGKNDNLCDFCPYWDKNKCTQTKNMNKWAISTDKKIAKYLKLKQNSIHKAKNIFNLSMDNIDIKNIKGMCNGCPYLDECMNTGINNAFRRDLK